MRATAKGQFHVEIKPLGQPEVQEGTTLGRMSLTKTFAGDLVGKSHGSMLTAMSGVQGSAGYVAIERVTGTLQGRAGGFVLQHSGTMARGAQSLTITVVPDTGTGPLSGLTGTLVIRIEEGQHFYEFSYELSGD